MEIWIVFVYVVMGYVFFRVNLNFLREGEIVYVIVGNVLLVVEKFNDYIFLSVSVFSLNFYIKGNLKVNNDV